MLVVAGSTMTTASENSDPEIATIRTRCWFEIAKNMSDCLCSTTRLLPYISKPFDKLPPEKAYSNKPITANKLQIK